MKKQLPPNTLEMRLTLFACAVIMTAKTANAINLEAASMLEVATFAQPVRADKVIKMAEDELDRIDKALDGLEADHKGNSPEANDLRRQL